jgi:hypothetical protein
MTTPSDPAANSDQQGRPSAAGGPTPPDDPFLRFDARLLDPTTAVRLPSGAAPSLTAYVGDTLLVTAGSVPEALAAVGSLDRFSRDQLDLRVIEAPLADWDNATRTSRHDRLAPLLAEAAALGLPLVVPVRFGRVDDATPGAPADVWPLLQRLRNDDDRNERVGLDHLMFAAAIYGDPVGARATSLIVGDPVGARATAVVNGNPVGARGTAEARLAYSTSGSGGRGPVTVVAPMPVRHPHEHPHGQDEPRVVVLDTGIGEHPWFTAQPAARELRTPGGSYVGLNPAEALSVQTDPERAGGVLDPMVGALASHSGHGTFIAGLLRQTCPDAELFALRVMDADGVVPEATLSEALLALAVAVRSGFRLHALVLSLGYYAETGDDATYTAGLCDLLAALAADGVATFAAAGNDASTQPSFPAAFARTPIWPDDAPRVVSVAAQNPDGTIALFSNDATWVVAQAVGANVVSTMPVTFDGSGEPDVATVDTAGRHRSTLDADNFSGGFATWSGTSFAAPIAAGRYLAALRAAGMPTDPALRRSLLPLR